MGSNLEQCGNVLKNGRFYQVDTAGLGKYRPGRYDFGDRSDKVPLFVIL